MSFIVDPSPSRNKGNSMAALKEPQKKILVAVLVTEIQANEVRRRGAIPTQHPEAKWHNFASF